MSEKQPEGNQPGEEKHWMELIPGPNLDGTWPCIAEQVRPENPNDIGVYHEFLQPGPDEFHFRSPEAFLKACKEGKVKGYGPGGKKIPNSERHSKQQACRVGKVKDHGPDGKPIPNYERHSKQLEGTQAKEEKHWMEVIPGPNLDGTWPCIAEQLRPENPNDIGQYHEFLQPGPDEFHFRSPKAFLKACREGKVKGYGPGGKTLTPEEERLRAHRLQKIRMKKRRNDGECGPKRNYHRKDHDDKDRDENRQNYQHPYCNGSAVRRIIDT
ncbi:hypothetical protein B9Z55_025411 [Caenorhabditis nigoni]|uniref:Uncharacterized protein n=1 Tax=Caenorhabditis nigoni TaxID=1611254 RepID=A0A2G5SYR1_9PELO|nr:hypothetical protein B9Z55_025411 [Caenorhabditis nigoni]